MPTSSRPTPTEADPDLDSGWDVDDNAAPPTRSYDEREEAAARGGHGSRTAPRPPVTDVPPSLDMNQRATLPPPVPTDEYVDTMMSQASEEEEPMPRGRHYRAPLATLLEMDPLQYDRAEDSRGSPFMTAAADETPMIETAEISMEVPPELLVNTLPPPAGSEVDELDMLPFDEVLDRISATPHAPSPRVPESTEILKGARRDSSDNVGLRLGATPPALASVEFVPPEKHSRATLPGARASVTEVDEKAKMVRRFDAKDFAGALILAESLLQIDPDDLDVQRCAEACRKLVTDMYLARLGDRRSLPRVVVSAEQLQRLALDHRSGFLLSCIDGSISLDELLDLSGMQPLETVRLLYELVQEGVLEIEAPPPKSSSR